MRWLAVMLLAVLSAVLMLQLQRAQGTLPAIGSAPVQETAQEAVAVNLPEQFAMADRAEFQVIAEQTLFHQSRSPDEGEAQNGEAGVDLSSIEEWDLTAVVQQSGQEPYAWFRHTGHGELRKLHQGDGLAGWQIEAIQPAHVAFAKDGTEHKMALRQYKAPEVPPAKLKPQPPGPPVPPQQPIKTLKR